MSSCGDDVLELHATYTTLMATLETARQSGVAGSELQLGLAELVELILTNEAPADSNSATDDPDEYDDEDDWDEKPPPLHYLYERLIENLEAQRRSAYLERHIGEFIDTIGYANCPDDAAKLGLLQQLQSLGREIIDDLIVRILANDEDANWQIEFFSRK
jgi:hypothetical protein